MLPLVLPSALCVIKHYSTEVKQSRVHVSYNWSPMHLLNPICVLSVCLFFIALRFLVPFPTLIIFVIEDLVRQGSENEISYTYRPSGKMSTVGKKNLAH